VTHRIRSSKPRHSTYIGSIVISIDVGRRRRIAGRGCALVGYCTIGLKGSFLPRRAKRQRGNDPTLSGAHGSDFLINLGVFLNSILDLALEICARASNQ
jgi:hypothetical protein